LHKYSKYFFFPPVAFAAVFLLSSCKPKQQATAAKQAVESPVPPGSNPDAWFGYMYVDGCAQRMKGNLQEALRIFSECLKVQPLNPAVNYELATIQKLLGHDDEALARIRVSATAEPENEWYQLLFIECLQAKHEYGQALRAREALVKRYPARSDFREELAIDYAATGQYEKSFRIYDELEKEYGINEQITMNKVKLLRSQNKMREVEKELLRLSETNKNEPQFYAYLAEFYLEVNEPEKAKSMYDRILAVDPGNATVHLALHDYYRQKGDESEAFMHLKSAFLNPDLDIATKAGIVGSFYSRAKQFQPGAAEYGKELAQLMLQVHPKAPESNALYADFLMLDKKTREAAEYYYQAAMNEKQDVGVWENLLFVENELQRFDSLEKHSALAMELFPNQARSYLYNGVANIQLGQAAKAARSLRDGLEFAPGSDAIRLDLLRLLGDVSFQLKDYARSDEAFEEALKIDPDNTYVLNNYAYYLSLRNHNLEHAASLSKHSLDLQPQNRNYMDTYGWILYKQMKYAEAESWLSKSAKASNSAVVLEHYGDVLYKLNRVVEANLQWNAARNAGGSSEELLRKIKEKKLND
jgi:tetratricopeptide (TPR) repeat protein